MKSIPERHPLRVLFDRLTQKWFRAIGLRDHGVTSYTSNLLADFVHIDNLYRIRNATGRRLYEVAELLSEADPHKTGLQREREIRKHIGDYTLFILGLFPESLEEMRPIERDYLLAHMRKGTEMMEELVRPLYYVWRGREYSTVDIRRCYAEIGKDSYVIVSAYSYRNPAEAQLFNKMARCFDPCVKGLNLVKYELERLQDPHYRLAKRMIAPNGPLPRSDTS
ncbi:MAG TPA: hypothetical protein EYP53_01690 [Candidatus Latescibacteria bacterium]|nr:hypothetical protein [Candidatus Latescibacterota bacterium]